jgi:hypothetical protein
MQELLEAIYNHFSHADMDLFLHGAEVGEALPYCVYFFINSAPEKTFTSEVEDAEIQFSIFADSAEHAMSLADDLQVLFDDCDLTVTGFNFLSMDRKISRLFKEDNGVWHHVTTYNVLIHK